MNTSNLGLGTKVFIIAALDVVTIITFTTNLDLMIGAEAASKSVQSSTIKRQSGVFTLSRIVQGAADVTMGTVWTGRVVWFDLVWSMSVAQEARAAWNIKFGDTISMTLVVGLKIHFVLFILSLSLIYKLRTRLQISRFIHDARSALLAIGAIPLQLTVKPLRSIEKKPHKKVRSCVERMGERKKRYFKKAPLAS